jgi:lysylphosphatidylglycerol synthetase-like protein (DUF2156 family)
MTVIVVALITSGATAGFAAWHQIDHHALRVLEPSGPEVLAAVVAIAVVGRGLVLGRPVTGAHGALAGAVLILAIVADIYSHTDAAAAAILVTGVLLVCPSRSQPQPHALPRVWSLVKATEGDPLAAFAMATEKSYVFSADATAAVAYRAVGGFAVVSGDPIGNSARFGEVVGELAALCRARGWRILVLGASASRLVLWQNHSAAGTGGTAVPIGRDVVINVDQFNLAGRRKRNLRQAVQRTRNAGVTTQVVAENTLDPRLYDELRDVMVSSHKAVGAERGFAMMLGGTLSGHFPGVWLIIARDRAGRIQGFQRYASTGADTDLSLDLPWRRPDAPNGIDERLSVDMIAWAKDRGIQRVSLAFAPFPDLFARNSSNSAAARALRIAAHLLDRFIKLESLYRYQHKFDAMGEQRYVLIPLTHIVAAAAILLAVEFMPHHDRGGACKGPSPQKR